MPINIGSTPVTLLFSLLQGAFPVFAAFTFTVTPPALNVHHSGARVIVSTSVPTTARVVWDMKSHPDCGSYPFTDTDGASHKTHSWFIGAVPSDTPIFWRWCANDGLGEVGSPEQSFITLPLPNPHPALAELPRTQIDTTMPVMTGVKRTIGVDCLDLVACWNLSNYGDTILIPPNRPQIVNTTSSSFVSRLLKKPWTSGWIVIRTAAPDSALPPEGTSLDPASYAGALATIENPAMNHYLAGTPTDNAHCYPGAYLWNHPASNAPGFYMLQCRETTSTPATIVNISGGNFDGNAQWGGMVSTKDPHGFQVGDIVYTLGVLGIPKANGTGRILSVPSPTSYTVRNAAGYNDPANTYTRGGTVVNHNWQPVPFIPVTLGALPAACPAGAWGYDAMGATQDADAVLGPQDANSSTGHVVRCVEKDTWRRWEVWFRDPMNLFGYSLDLAGNTHVRVIGLRLSRVKVPEEPLFLRDGGNPEAVTGFQGGKEGQGFIRTGSGFNANDPFSSDIIIDRCWLDGLGYPYGASAGAAVLNGDRVAVIDSAITDVGHWFGPLDRGPRYDNYASAAILRSAGTTFLFRNNRLQTDGLGFHNDDSLADWYTNVDLTFERNTFFRKPSHFYGDPVSDGIYRPERQDFECKACQRLLFTGNSIENNWRNVSAGAAIALTPRMESSINAMQSYGTAVGTTLTWSFLAATHLSPGSWVACDDQLYQIQTTPTANSATIAPPLSNGSHVCPRADWPGGIMDVTITNNTFRRLPNVFSVFGVVNPDIASVPSVATFPLQRITLRNNLYDDIDDSKRADPFVWQSNGGSYVMFPVTRYALDILSEHETHLGIRGPVFGGSVGSGLKKTSEGIRIANNLSSMVIGSTNSPITGGGGSGSAMMAEMYANSFLGNSLYQMTGGNPGGYPRTISWLRNVAEYKFYDAGRHDYRLRADSPCVSGSHLTTDGLDCGANVDALSAAQGQVSNVRVRSATPTTAIVSFFAPDSFGCSVDWKADPSAATFTRVANAGGGRIQDVTLSGLPQSWWYRVNCAVWQPTGSFVMR